jgi:prepilin peptidase CpaA
VLLIYSFLLLAVGFAAVVDIAKQKIPNWLVLIVALIGLGWNFFSVDGLGLADAGIGLIAGMLLMLPGYIFASMGAGDVKLMMAIGSVVGFSKVMDIVLYGYIAMIAMAILYIICRGGGIKLLVRYKGLFYGLWTGSWAYQKTDNQDVVSRRLPLAPAIALSTVYVLYPEFCNFEFMVNLCHFRN